jgi:hypothetical protein
MRHFGSAGALKRGVCADDPTTIATELSPAVPILMVPAIEIGPALLADVVATFRLGIFLGLGATIVQILLDVVFRRLRHRLRRWCRWWSRCRRFLLDGTRSLLLDRTGRLLLFNGTGRRRLDRTRTLRDRRAIGFGRDRSPAIGETVRQVGVIGRLDGSDGQRNRRRPGVFRLRRTSLARCPVGQQSRYNCYSAKENAGPLCGTIKGKFHVTIVFLACCRRANRSKMLWVLL